MTCEALESFCTRVWARIPIPLDFAAVAANLWRPGTLYSGGDLIRSARHPGFEFEAGSDGQSGDREPRWPKTLGDTVQDGSIEWTAAAVTTGSLLKALASVTWEVDASITVSGELIDSAKQTAIAYLLPASAGTYEVIVWATFDDSPAQKEPFLIELTVEE